MIATAWAISYNRKKFPWRTVLWGLGEAENVPLFYDYGIRRRFLRSICRMSTNRSAPAAD